MKQVICTLALIWPFTLHAQTNEGTIIYEEIIKINISDMPELEAFAAMIPKEQRSVKLLYYTKEATLYKNDPTEKEEATNSIDNGGMKMVMKMDRPEDIVYKDLAAGKTYEQKEFMGRRFMIEGEVKQPGWKLGTGTKNIAGYPCRDAVLIKDKDTINVWFTTAIPIASGPYTLSGLPGMILEVNIGNRVHVVAKEIKNTVDHSMLEKPRSGKKVSAEDFEKMVEEKTKEMEQLQGGDGNRVIIRREVH